MKERKILNNDVIRNLIEELKNSELQISSYWQDMFKEYEYKNGEFIGKGLPEGKGGYNGVFKEFMHYLLQTPFRLQGSQFSEFNNILKTAKSCHKYRDNKIRLGTLRQVITLALLEKHININQLIDPIVIIGDGYGFMASLILSHFYKLRSKVVVINLNKNLLMDAVYIQKSVPKVKMALVRNGKEYVKALKSKEASCILVQADNAEILVQSSIELVINIASMQEMNPPIINKYFEYIRGSKNSKTYFYCANRVEKFLPDGTIVNFFSYPWHPKDEILIDELCPWHQKYYRLRPPFYFDYDGPHQHRLILCHK